MFNKLSTPLLLTLSLFVATASANCERDKAACNANCGGSEKKPQKCHGYCEDEYRRCKAREQSPRKPGGTPSSSSFGTFNHI